MAALAKPKIRPANPRFSPGPCRKHPGWSLEKLSGAVLGRGHRSAEGRARLRQAVALTRQVLEIPETFRIAIVPGSDTGAVEMAMWSLLGQRPVEIAAWDSFGRDWLTDATEQLGLPVTAHVAEYGRLPDFGKVNFDSDVVFTWNGTTSGVRLPDGSCIPRDRRGLTICDATSAAFAMELPWDRLDATTFSWQKALGGEAAHGMLVLSPRAVERLRSWSPPWPIPKLFRIARNGEVNEDLFDGSTVNTPSLLCVEDFIAALRWAESIGGLPAMIARTSANAMVLEELVRSVDWLAYLAEIPETRSHSSVCLRFAGPAALETGTREFGDGVAKLLAAEGVAFDVSAYRNAPPGLRIWCGGTVETEDVKALCPWIEWAYLRQCESLAG